MRLIFEIIFNKELLLLDLLDLLDLLASPEDRFV